MPRAVAIPRTIWVVWRLLLSGLPGSAGAGGAGALALSGAAVVLAALGSGLSAWLVSRSGSCW